jgi:K+-sensing histidine kinase KdpD
MTVPSEQTALHDQTALPAEQTDQARASGSPVRAGLNRDWLTRDRLAVAAGLAAPLILAAVLVPFRGSFANTDAALALILVVVAVAAVGNRLAGYVAAVSAAVWFDFFLTRPYEQFTINRATDITTTVLLLLIGVAVTEIAVWGRRQHAAANRRAGYLDGINDAARAVATGGSPSALIDQVASSLTKLLSLRSCQFQYGVAGIGRPARLERDGEILLDGLPLTAGESGLPADISIELLVESGGRLRGRFLMLPAPLARPTREQLLVAVALADQAGAAQASSQPAAA